jgi:acyl carrier protein
MMKDRIFEITSSALRELNSSINSPDLENPTVETRLYGAKSALDSISLVTLIADIEDRISTEFGKDIVLADERAMSQTRSPFGRVGTLVDYIELLLAEDQ